MLNCRAGRQGIFYNATIEDNLRNLKRIQELISPKKLISTVSPIPLLKTFTGLPKEEANLASKTKLREAVRQLDGVNYFDSYEYCMERGDIFQADGRHVRDEVVKDVVARFYSKKFF